MYIFCYFMELTKISFSSIPATTSTRMSFLQELKSMSFLRLWMIAKKNIIIINSISFLQKCYRLVFAIKILQKLSI